MSFNLSKLYLLDTPVSFMGDGSSNHQSIPNEEVYPQINAGDVLVTKGAWDHIAMIVGFGPAGGGANSPFYPSYEEAVQALGSDVVPYAVDHGGNNPQGYPRPIGVWADGPRSVYIISLDYPTRSGSSDE